MKIKVSDYIAQFMIEHGVKHVFTVTGGGAMHLNDSLGHKEGLKCIYNHHEQACAIAAEGYARLSGNVALVCVTSGPGGTNAITGVVGGWQDSIPMFVISGQVKRETTTWSTDVPLRQLGDQEFQIIDSVKNMTKYAVMITEQKDIRYHLEKAWYLCNNGRKGPVWLDIPIDVQAAIVETDDMRGYDLIKENDNQKPVYDNKITPSIISKITEAKKPVLLVGTGVRLAGACKELLKVVEIMKIPVVTAWNAHDLLADDNKYYCGRPGSVGTRGGNFVVQNSDLLFVLGCRMNIRQISYNYKSFAKNAYKIVVDIDEAELRKPTIHVDMPIQADLKDVLVDILALGNDFGDHTDWLDWCRSINQRYPADLPEYYGKERLNPYVFVKKFTELLCDDDAIICGNGSACVITFQTAVIKQGQRLFTNSGCAAMGYGFPAAIGACISRGNKRTICIDGDGSIMMNLQELQTVRYNNLNLKIIIINNNGYHSIRQTQNNLFKPPLVGVCDGNGVSFPDFEKVAYAFDIPFLRIKSEADISPFTDRLFEITGPVICEVIVDEKQNFEPKLSSRKLDDGTMISPEIDDMFPFLRREEYEKNHIG
ncbi:MAG: thiamine pyrophosphate-binding protein [Lachnospiraceae bacterium]|nr:thiamine pyrophosphate-binding protein [Lachnospiraceae bacterium]